MTKRVANCDKARRGEIFYQRPPDVFLFSHTPGDALTTLTRALLSVFCSVLIPKKLSLYEKYYRQRAGGARAGFYNLDFDFIATRFVPGTKIGQSKDCPQVGVQPLETWCR